MKKYILTSFVFVFVLLGFNAISASADNDSGCVGNTGYSTTTGVPCDQVSDGGTSQAYDIIPKAPNIPYTSDTTSTFILPTGCTSNFGFSAITGAHCTGLSNTPITKPASILPGCSSFAGFSATTGSPCDGSPKVIYQYEPVCTPEQGYSTETGLCNTFRRLNPTLPPGCTSTDGKSSITGLSCTTSSYPSGCHSYAGWSSTTGLACDEVSVATFPTKKITSPSPVISNPSSSTTNTSTQTNTSAQNYSITNTHSPTCTIKSTLRIGSTGNDVACLQLHIGLIPDGKFGSRTQIAVKAFQANAGLKADGVVGPRSIKALEVDN